MRVSWAAILTLSKRGFFVLAAGSTMNHFRPWLVS